MSKRVVVPELPQSIGSLGALGPFAPQPVMPPYRLPSGAFSRFTLAPSLLTRAKEARTSSESSTPERRGVPEAIAAKSTARCEMDLSPAHRDAADKRAVNRLDSRKVFLDSHFALLLRIHQSCRLRSLPLIASVKSCSRRTAHEVLFCSCGIYRPKGSERKQVILRLAVHLEPRDTQDSARAGSHVMWLSREPGPARSGA